ncbi:Pre-mRNA-splicing factor, partial [Nowakowskiella sp. JEL0078]
TAVRRHFELWGEIENIRILEAKAVAFVRYKYRVHAEFAKEAMFGQSLDKNEVLNVRWATEDPNPKVMEDIKRKNQDMMLERFVERLPQIGDQGTVLDYESYYDTLESSKKARFQEPVGMSGDAQFGFSYAPEESTQEYVFDSSWYANYGTSGTFQTYEQPSFQAYEQPSPEEPLTKPENQESSIISSSTLQKVALLNQKADAKRKAPPPPPPRKQKSFK